MEDNDKVLNFLELLSKAVTRDEVYRLMQETYNNFSSLLENLQSQTNFPLQEGNPLNLWNHLAEYCYRASVMDPSFKELSVISYEKWYEAMLKSEIDKDKRSIHKGMPLHQLGILSLNNKELAKRYFLLAYIEDVQESLTENRNSYIQPSYRVLNGQYRIPTKELDALKKTVEEFREERYPEKILMEFLLKKKTYREVAPPQATLKQNTFYLNDLLNKAKTAQTNDEKGKSFTRLASYIFSSVAGFEIIGENINSLEHDYDLLIRNLATDNPTFINFGDYIIVECKFVDESSGIDVLSKLIYKLRYHDCKCGILFTKKGVARGIKENLTLKKAFNRDSTLILVLDESDIEAIIKGEQSIIGSLLAAYHTTRFDI